MPRFFDDYSNTYLTHDSAAGRKQQRRGWKFRENFKLHYQHHIPEWYRGEMGLADAQHKFLRARGAQDPAVPPLPEGWKEDTDEVTGITFYIDTNTKKRTWVRPSFVPPPLGGGPGPRGPPPPPQFYAPQPPPPMGYTPAGMGGPPPLPPPPPAGTSHNQSLPPPPPFPANLPPPPQPQFFQPAPGQGLPPPIAQQPPPYPGAAHPHSYPQS